MNRDFEKAMLLMEAADALNESGGAHQRIAKLAYEDRKMLNDKAVNKYLQKGKRVPAHLIKYYDQAGDLIPPTEKNRGKKYDLGPEPYSKDVSNDDRFTTHYLGKDDSRNGATNASMRRKQSSLLTGDATGNFTNRPGLKLGSAAVNMNAEMANKSREEKIADLRDRRNRREQAGFSFDRMTTGKQKIAYEKAKQRAERKAERKAAFGKIFGKKPKNEAIDYLYDILTESDY